MGVLGPGRDGRAHPAASSAGSAVDRRPAADGSQRGVPGRSSPGRRLPRGRCRARGGTSAGLRRPDRAVAGVLVRLAGRVMTTVLSSDLMPAEQAAATSLVDLLDRLLGVGVVLAGDLT